MYRIKFYDFDNKLVATHKLQADNLLCSPLNAEKYCKIIAKQYKNVNRWFIFDYYGDLLVSGKLK